MSSEAKKAPDSEPMPPTTTTTKMIGADGSGHGRLGQEGAAANHTGQAGQRRAGAEHQHEHARHVVAQGLHRIRVGRERPG